MWEDRPATSLHSISVGDDGGDGDDDDVGDLGRMKEEFNHDDSASDASGGGDACVPGDEPKDFEE